jgi:hypothetical protein
MHQDYGYATDNAGWISSDRAVLKWSPDSKKIATFRRISARSATCTRVNTVAGHPTPKRGVPAARRRKHDDRACDHRRRGGEVTRVKMGQDQHRSTLCDDALRRRLGRGAVESGQQPIAFVSTPRNHQQENLGWPTPAAERSARCSKAETFLEWQRPRQLVSARIK